MKRIRIYLGVLLTALMLTAFSGCGEEGREYDKNSELVRRPDTICQSI